MDLPGGGSLGAGNTNDEPMFLSVKKLWLQYGNMRSGGAVLKPKRWRRCKLYGETQSRRRKDTVWRYEE